jgi:hypothetical protein
MDFCPSPPHKLFKNFDATEESCKNSIIYVCREKEEEVVRAIGICDTKSIGKKLVRAETKILFWL